MTDSHQTAVLIAAFNAGATLDRAVASALAQPETAELCIVDDGSRDDTLAQAQAWAARDPRVSVLSQANAGPGAARNAAIAATTAPWLAILDADDYWLPGRLGSLLAQAQDADFIADALLRVADGAEPPSAPAAATGTTRLSFELFVLGNLGALKGPLDLGYLKPLMRRAFLDAHALRYRSDLRLGEDYEMYARALALGARVLIAPPAGYVSVERAGSLSTDHSEEDLLRLRDCDGPLARLRPLRPSEQRALRRHYASVDCRLQWRRLISAVKTRNLPAAVSTFRSPTVALYLAARLTEQAWLRSAAATRAIFSNARPPVRA
jgi:succinoglycan biosynthesis protein ExoU